MSDIALLILLAFAGPWDSVRPMASGPWDNVVPMEVEFPVTPQADEPAAEMVVAPAAKEPPKILRWERRCGEGGCKLVPIYADDGLTIDQAAARLAKGGLTPEEDRRLSAIVDGPAIAKALRQEWSVGTCQMLCARHGSILYDIHEDGTRTPAVEQPAEAPNEGVSGRSGRVRIFGRRR